MSNKLPSTGHTVTGLKFASLRSNEPDRVGCGGSIDGTRCSWTGSVMPDLSDPDPHTPMVKLFAGHSGHLYRSEPGRATNGTRKGPEPRVRLEYGR